MFLRPEASHLCCKDNSISLPITELQIIAILLKAAGGTVRRSALEQAAWGLSKAVTPNALDVALHRLRKKLRLIHSNVDIQNRRGLGYALHESTE
ncbi:helix-turn-helix domain-containing protein [Vibrio sp. PP-XX7]